MNGSEDFLGATMIIVESIAAALILIALGTLLEADTRDMRVRVRR